MGYTHYFKKKELEHDQKTWDNFLKDSLKVASRFKLQVPVSYHYIMDTAYDPDIDIEIGDGMGDGGSPVFDNNEICFNGVGEDSHETFRVNRDDSYLLKPVQDSWTKHQQEVWNKEGTLFNFTKTNRKPYDLLVTSVMILYKHHFGESVDISGDGGIDGFEEGAKLINDTLGYEINLESMMRRD